MIERGDIYYIIDFRDNVGSEQNAGRPAIIVSNNLCNKHSPVVEVVFLTTQPKTDLPTHVTIRSTAKVSTAICEQISSVSLERLGDFAGTCNEQEMLAIDAALCTSLALSPTKVSEEIVPEKNHELLKDLRSSLQRSNMERDMYKSLYDDLIRNILNRGTTS